MNIVSVLTIAVGVFGGLGAFFLIQHVAKFAPAFYIATFHEADREALYRGLAWILCWAILSAFLSLDFRTTPEFIQYLAMGLSLISVMAAYVVISLNVGSRSGFQDWRSRPPTIHSPAEQRRRGIASDSRAVLWFLLSLIIGGNSAVIIARLAAYRFDGHWFAWLLS